MQRLNRYQIVLAVLLAVAIAEETKVAEAADQQVAATVYGHHGGFYGHGPFYGLHHRGYFGHGYGHGHGYRYGRSVAADVEGQESGHGAYYGHPGFHGRYYGHGHGHRYGRSVAADVEGQESVHGGYYGHPGFYGQGLNGRYYGHGHRYGRSVAADVEGQESHSSSFVKYDDLNGGYGYGLYRPRYGYYHHQRHPLVNQESF